VTAGPPSERRIRPANRRQLILAAAAELFAARGYEYVGMSEIAGGRRRPAVGAVPAFLR